MDRFAEIEARLLLIREQESALRDEKKALELELCELHASSRGFRAGGLIEWVDKAVTRQGKIEAVREGSYSGKFTLAVRSNDGDFHWVGSSKKPRPIK
jgi:hypothetical protein